MMIRWHRMLVGTALAAAILTGPLSGEQPATIGDAEFTQLHQLIKPQTGESPWMEIDWHPNIWEARQRAAAEGKPLFLMAGSGGAPAAGC